MKKRAEVSILATILILLITIGFLVGVFKWYSTISTGFFTNVESTPQASSIQVGQLVNGMLSVQNTLPTTVSISKLNIGGSTCSIGVINLLPKKFSLINVSSCISNASPKYLEVGLYTPQGVFSKTVSVTSSTSISSIVSPIFSTLSGGIFTYTPDNPYVFTNIVLKNITSGATVCSFSTPSAIDTTNLVGHWTFDTEGSRVYDSSGLRNDGYLLGTSNVLYSFDDDSTQIKDKTAFNNNGKLVGNTKLLMHFDDTNSNVKDELGNEAYYTGSDTKLVMNFDDGTPKDSSTFSNQAKTFDDTVLLMHLDGDTKDSTGYGNDGTLINSQTMFMSHFEEPQFDNYLYSFHPGFLAKYTFDSGTGADSSAYGILGTLQNGMTCSTYGVIGRGCGLDGVDDYINVPSTIALGSTTTLMGWIYLDQLPATEYIPFGSWREDIDQRDIAFRVKSTGNIDFTVGPSSATETWVRSNITLAPKKMVFYYRNIF